PPASPRPEGPGGSGGALPRPRRSGPERPRSRGSRGAPARSVRGGLCHRRASLEERRPCPLELAQQLAHRGKSAVPLQDHRERPRHAPAHLAQERVNGIGYVVKVVVEETSLAAGARYPPPAREVNGRDALPGKALQERERIELEVGGVGVEVVEVEEKVDARSVEHPLYPGRLVA